MRFASIAIASLTVSAALLTGCASNSNQASDPAPPRSSSVEVSSRYTPYQDIDINQVDHMVIERVMVTPVDIKHRWGIPPQEGLALPQLSPETQSLGEEFSAALQRELIAATNRAGIRAYTRENAPQRTFRTAVIKGFYFQGELGSPGTARGFQIVDGRTRMRLLFDINNEQTNVGQATVDLRTAMDPALTGTQRTDIINAEARMTAQEIVDDLIIPAYTRRGWPRNN